jgi:CHAT domain-containing protein
MRMPLPRPGSPRWRPNLVFSALVVVGMIIVLAPAVPRPTYGAPLLQAPSPLADPAQRQEAATLFREGSALWREGDLPGALERLHRALSLYHGAGDRANERAVLSAIGGVYIAQRDYARVVEYGVPTLALARELGDRPTEQRTLNNLALAYSGLSEYAPSLDHAQQALVLAQALGDPNGERTALTRLWLAHRALGQDAQALGALQQSLARARELGDRQEELASLDRLGVVYNRLGQPARALEVLQPALALARELGDRRTEAAILPAIGAAHRDLGRPAEAVELNERALSLAAETGDRAGEVVALNNIALTYARLGQNTQRLEVLEQALTLTQQVPGRPREQAIVVNLAGAHLSAGRPGEALELSQRALSLAPEQASRGSAAAPLTLMGQAYAALGDLPAALDAYQQAIAASEDMRTAAQLDEFKTIVAERAAYVHERATLLLLQLDQPGAAFEMAERARARTFLDQLGGARPAVARGVAPQLAQQEQTLRGEIGALDEQLRQERAQPAAQQDAQQTAHLGAQLAARQTAHAALLTQLKLADPEAASLVSVDPLTLPEVQRLLPTDTTLLSYFVAPERALAFIVRRDAFQVVELPVREQALRESVDAFRRFGDPSDAWRGPLEQLSQWLLAPLADELTTPVVALVPHGSLHYLPFAALPTAAGLLGETHTLHYLPSASVLPFIQDKRRGAADRLLALAQSRPAGLPALRFADVEVASIASLYGTQPLLGAAATTSALRQQAPEAQIIHLAAHGELNEQSPLFSRLFLAPDGTTDGSLTVQDVYGLNLEQADLVVLSACETQLGQQSRGDELVGLNRAFMYAGTPSVIASLWSVNDEATAVLMGAFYRHLRAGASKAEALRRAQVETRAQYPHPYYWAAFVLTGDPGTSRPPS